MKIEIVEATIDHARDLAPRLRESDAAEVYASCGANPEQALVMSVNVSRLAWTALLNGEPEIMWGAADYDYLPGSGIVWLLSSDEMYRVRDRFLLESEVHVAKMLRHYDMLFNYVHTKNIKSQQWLERLGFKALSRHEDFGFAGESFTLYSRNRYV